MSCPSLITKIPHSIHSFGETVQRRTTICFSFPFSMKFLPLSKDRIIRGGITFESCARDTTDHIGSAEPVRPGGLGYFPGLLKVRRNVELGGASADQRYAWKDLEIAIEVKDDWTDMVERASTYARAMFFTRRSRQRTLVLCYNQKTREIRLCFFMRKGFSLPPHAISTNPNNLKTLSAQW